MRRPDGTPFGLRFQTGIRVPEHLRASILYHATFGNGSRPLRGERFQLLVAPCGARIACERSLACHSMTLFERKNAAVRGEMRVTLKNFYS
jgi:hypothetical protein